MKNQVIEVLDEEHGKKVIQYWRDRGVDTGGAIGVCSKEKGDFYRYYGVINGYFDIYSLKAVNDFGATIITLPEPEWKPKRGEKVLVWDDDEAEQEEVFLTEIEGAVYPIITVELGDEKKFFLGEKFTTVGWKNMKPLPPVKEVTMQEIADKFGVSVEQLKIKK